MVARGYTVIDLRQVTEEVCQVTKDPGQYDRRYRKNDSIHKRKHGT